MHRLRDWSTIAWVPSPPTMALSLSPPRPAPPPPASTLIVVSTTSPKELSLVASVILWWKVAVVVWGTKHWDGGYIVAHWVVLLIVLLRGHKALQVNNFHFTSTIRVLLLLLT